MRVVGVTGTNGKTSTVWLAGSVGRAARMRVLTSSSLGLECDGTAWPDVPASLDGLLQAAREDGVDMAVLELTSRTLAEGVTESVRLDAAALTNLSEDHLDIHGTMEAYAAAKGRLFSAVAPGGVVVLPERDPFSAMMTANLNPGVRVVHLGPTGRYWLADTKLDPAGTTLKVASAEGTGPTGSFRIPLIGQGFARNALVALAVTAELGFSADAIARGLASVAGIPGRFQIIAKMPLVVVDFAHTPAALQDALATARALTSGRVLLVFGAGGDRMQSKRAPMGRAAAELADLVWITSDNPRSEDPLAIAQAVRAGWAGVNTDPPWIELHRPSAIESAIEEAEEDDLVLIAGMGADAYRPTPDAEPVTDAGVVAGLSAPAAHSRQDG